MSTTATASIHTPGTTVTGTYCGVPITGSTVESRVHHYNWDRYEVTVALDAESAQRVAAEGYLATGNVIVACEADGSAPQAQGWDSDWLAVVS